MYLLIHQSNEKWWLAISAPNHATPPQIQDSSGKFRKNNPKPEYFHAYGHAHGAIREEEGGYAASKLHKVVTGQV